MKIKKIDKYTLIEKLGFGGNSEVWKVKDQNQQEYAMKILKNIFIKNNILFKRFKYEIQTVKDNNNLIGIIPILDSFLQASTKDIPYWYVMPIATPIIEKISKTDIYEIAKAILSIAKVLIYFHNIGISHRDIKPENLYYYNNNWCIGDFGLVDFPHKSKITKEKKLGPIWTIAPEMRRSPQNSDGRLADVYSLSKTFWILLTNVYDGFDGRYDASDENISLKRFIKNDFLFPIDNLLRDCTNENPSLRPTMNIFINKIEEWLTASKDFSIQNILQWNYFDDHVHKINKPARMVWNNIDDIISILSFLCETENLNHLFLPRGGGLDLIGVKKSNEPGCLDLDLNGSCYIIKPKRLIYENFHYVPEWNYLRIETKPIKAIIYESIIEELTEIKPNEYVDRSVWDSGYYYDGPLPKGARLVSRIQKGALVIFAKQSLYNKDASTYDGRHNKMNTNEFRNYIYKNVRKIIKENKDIEMKNNRKLLLSSLSDENKIIYNTINLAIKLKSDRNILHKKYNLGTGIELSNLSSDYLLESRKIKNNFISYLRLQKKEFLALLVGIMYVGREYYNSNEIYKKESFISYSFEITEYIMKLLEKSELHLYLLYGVFILKIYTPEELYLLFRFKPDYSRHGV